MTFPWNECVGEAYSWLLGPLVDKLGYDKPLPVQQAVIPTVRRALMSGLPMDVCLTAPTGSGKTLCYLLPLLQLITEHKRGVNSTRLLGLVLVPTKALGHQVMRELHFLTRGTTITTVSLCDDTSVKEEAAALVRSVRLMDNAARASGGRVDSELGLPNRDGGNAVLACSTGMIRVDSESGDANVGGGSGANGDEGSNNELGCADSALVSSLRYYSRADIVISTPQRLLRHLDGTAGFTLADLRLLVIDEADQVLSGNFSNFVAKVVERFEEEQLSRVGDTKDLRRLMQLNYSLHKFLCSATLSSQMTRISEVRLRNCRHFTLDSYGEDIKRDDEGEPIPLTSTKDEVKERKRKHDPRVDSSSIDKRGKRQRGSVADDESCTDEDCDKPAAPLAPAKQLVRTSFALPPRLQEHVVFVEDWYRHAVLLKLVRAIIDKQNAAYENNQEGSASPLEKDSGTTKPADSTVETDEEDVTKECDDAAFRVVPQTRRGRRSRGLIAPDGSYPSCDDDAGRRIIIFCRSADEARVMGHFLLSAGVRATEFTTLATESERRRALLKSPPDSCVVASDALMRGIDVPNVGHVIMYNPPESLSQYVHRAGRTARTMRAGHLHLLLQKNGPSGTQEDGEVAMFKAISSAISRSQPVRYERHFFTFEMQPALSTRNAPLEAPAATGKEEGECAKKDKTRLLVEEADAYLEKTQARLAGRWVSALESVTKKDFNSKQRSGRANEMQKKRFAGKR
ncbi:unnamed protein product [Trypanosoma congolense IL3000]|uniref:WGS project CAEQ00000000 data, annotated contig 517 n=1 Tax=Trypanosoma congolense (strain IL3000) TaxID=1068625 RepID=F9WGM3_TRYCI|nr:unnamed protein product [Trypanosoma congolense IL3000]